MSGAETSHPVGDSLKALLDLQGRPEFSVENPVVSGEAADQLERIFFVASDADKAIGNLYGQ
jgi:hypothetical protein